MQIKPTSNSARTEPAEAVTHWNYGAASRKPEVPTGDTRYHPDWYKRDTEPKPRPGPLARLREMFL